MNWEIISYIIIACVTLAGIATTLYLWLNHRRLDRQAKALRQKAYTEFEQAASQAEQAGMHTEAKLARTLRDMWK